MRRRHPATPWLLFLLLAPHPACGGGGGEPQEAPGAAGAAPELSVESLSFSPSQAQAGETIHVVDVVANSGGVQTGAFDVDVYLSADPHVTSADVHIGERTVAALGPGQTSVGSGFLTVPAGLGQGLWHLGAVVDPDGTVAEGDEADNVRVALQTLTVSSAPAPDLRIVRVDLGSQTVEAGQVVTVGDTVENVGPGAATAFQVGIYLSADASITPGDVLIGLRSVPALGPGELSHLDGTLTVPASTAAGPWFVGALADVGGSQGELDEFNNSGLAAQPLVVSAPPRPDLRVTQIAFTPNALDAGEALTLDEAVVNQGLAAAGPFRVGIFLSEDELHDADDTLIGFRSLAGLGIGESSATSAALVVPASVGGGTFHVVAVADHEGGLVEADEDNNVAVALGTLEVHVPPMPDLRPTAVAFSPGVVAHGGTLTVVERVENVGSVAAQNLRVGIYLSSNPVVTSSDVLLATRIVPQLPVGGVDEAQTVVVLPGGLGSGSWTLGVIADDLAAIPESEEGDNLLVAAGQLDVTGSPEPRADLVVESLAATPDRLLVDGALTVQSLVRNQGELSTGPFQVRFYLSEDDVIESSDHLVGARTIFQLGIGSGSAQSFPYTLDGSLPLGVYHFGAVCDEAGVVLESDEGNNVFVLPGTIEIYEPPPPAPDLLLAELDLDPTTVPVGGSLEVTQLVRNAGDLASGSYRVEVFLSEDDELDAGDLSLGTSPVSPGLDPGGQSPGSLQLVLPASVEAGTWYLAATVSVLDGPLDSNPGNDSRVATATLEVSP